MLLPIPDCFVYDDIAYVPLGELKVYEREGDDWVPITVELGAEMESFGQSLAASADASWVNYLWANGWDGLPVRRSSDVERGPLERAVSSKEVDLDELRTVAWCHMMTRGLDRARVNAREDKVFTERVLPLFREQGLLLDHEIKRSGLTR